ncbi:MAG: BatA domain-containing protein [Bacteroidota bacterium]
MQFVYPGFLFALSALSIPIIIHLFNFRRFKRILFTNVRFLQEIKQDTRSRSKLKHLLILLARLLAIAFLVLAFAQPLIPASNAVIIGGIKNVSVYIDNSFSMDAIGKNGSLIESAKRKAREIANAYQPVDHFQLLTNDFEGRHQRIVNREEFLQMVDEVKLSSSVRSLSEVVTRQKDAMRNIEDIEHKIDLYEISDFQKSVADIENISYDSTIQINLVPLVAASKKNLFIDTCSLATPFVQLNTQNELTIRLQNISDADAESVPVKLFINGTQRSLTSLTIPAQSSAETKLSFTVSQPGWQQAKISIADDPVVFDDNYFLSFEVKDHLNVLSINETKTSPYIDALFGTDPYFQLKNSPVNQVDYAAFLSDNLIVLNNLKEISSGLAQELKKYVSQGGALMIFPGQDINSVSYQDFYQAIQANPLSRMVEADDKVSFIEKKNPIFSDVFEKKNVSENIDYPLVSKHYQSLAGSHSSQEVLMKLQSGDVFFSSMQSGKGKIYLCASPLDETCTNFPRHALFVPLMLKAAMSGFNSFQQSQVVGANNPIEIPAVQLSGENLVHLLNNDEKFDIIPETRLVNGKPVIIAHNQVTNSGNYSLVANDKLLAAVSFNFDRRESDLSCFSAVELKAMAEKSGFQTLTLLDENKELTHTIASQNEGTRLWKYCIWLTLLFLACEVLLIRFMSAAKPISPKP